MNAGILIPLYIAIVIAYVLLPIVIVSLLETRKARQVTCPGDGKKALVVLDPGRFCWTMVAGGRQTVCACDRWPDRADCDCACAKAMEGVPA